MPLLTRRLLGRTAVASLASLALISAGAQTWPNKPVRLVVAFPPGGPTDILARIVATGLGRALDSSVIVDNKVGGGGLIGAQAVAKADPDGYTLMFAGDGQLTLLPQITAKPGYDAVRDFVPIRLVAGQSNVLIVNKASGVTDMVSLIARAKANPGTLSYGSAGNGTPSQLVGALFENATGTKLLHVPYRGTGPAMTDLLGGQTQLMFVGTPVALQQLSRQQLVVLAITGNKRSPKLPNIPTFQEAGIAGLGNEMDVWWAIVAPRGIPQPVQVRLEQAMKTALADTEVRNALVMAGVDLLDKDADIVGQWVRRDYARWATLIKAGTISTE